MLYLKFKKLAAVLALSGVLFAGSLVPASAAGNIDDTAFEFKFAWWNTTGNTEGRAKNDNTSSYVNCTWIPGGGFRVYVDGYGSNGYVDCTVREAYIPDTGEYQVLNLVYERGYRTARLGGTKSFGNTYASGVWSPDSVGSYTIANN